MKRFIVHDEAGNILRQGSTSNNNLDAQVSAEGETVREVAPDVQVSDVTHKVNPTRSIRGARLIKEDIVDKSAEEIELANPTRPPVVRVPMARITQQEWDSILARLNSLEV